MLKNIPVFMLVTVFGAVGIYLALFTRDFLVWNRRFNEKLHRTIDSHLARPVLVARAQTNYLRMLENGGLTFFIWSIRVIGAGLLVCSIVTMVRIISLNVNIIPDLLRKTYIKNEPIHPVEGFSAVLCSRLI